MAYKLGVILMAPDADPKVHKASIKTAKSGVSVVLTQNDNIDQAIAACKELVRKEGTQSFILCPGFSNTMVARIKEAVGDEVAVCVARPDGPSYEIVGRIHVREGWSSKRH